MTEEQQLELAIQESLKHNHGDAAKFQGTASTLNQNVTTSSSDSRGNEVTPSHNFEYIYLCPLARTFIFYLQSGNLELWKSIPVRLPVK